MKNLEVKKDNKCKFCLVKEVVKYNSKRKIRNKYLINIFCKNCSAFVGYIEKKYSAPIMKILSSEDTTNLMDNEERIGVKYYGKEKNKHTRGKGGKD